VKPECLEIDRNLRQILVERGFHRYEQLASIQKTFDAIYTSNVLEHIEDDVEVLKQLHSKLKQDGIIAIYVPAFMCLFSELDTAVGHYRRYSKKEIINKLKIAQFKVLDCWYVDSMGFFASLAVKFLGYKDSATVGRNKTFKIFDKYIYPISMIFDRFGFRYLFGKSLLVIAKKQELYPTKD
jgi:predicted SAM-dependent methyltransferase